MEVKKSILIVDDKPENLFVLRELILEFFPDMEIRTASSAEEAMYLLTPTTSLVLSDVQMPGTSGVDLCRQIKAEPELVHIPVLLITSHHTTSGARVKGLEAGAIDFISRPIDTEELAAKIGRNIDAWETRELIQRERNTLRDELHLAERQYKILFKNATDAIFIVNEAQQIIDANKECAALLACAEEKILGTFLSEYVAPGSAPITLVEDDEDEVPAVETSFIACDGQQMHVGVRSRMVNLGTSHVWWVIVRDVTERKRAEDALLEKEASLEKALMEAKAANMAKSEFVSNMSHELRTPLNGIVGMLQLMLTEVETDEAKGYANMALQASNRLTALLGDILDLSMVEANKLTIAPESFSIQSLLEQLRELFQPRVDQIQVDLILQMDDNIPDLLNGDPTRIFQIATNLVGNALKFTVEGAIRVNVMFTEVGNGSSGRLIFEVSDTGQGIAEKDLSKLGRPFTQVKGKDLRPNKQGVGLGLSICNRLVRLMNGSLCISSEVGVGTSVLADMQVGVDMDSGKANGKNKVAECYGLDGQTVLVAEDDHVSSLFLEKLLSKRGAVVTVVGNGQEAIEKIQHAAYDWVLMDIQMPVMDGLEATRALRSGAAGERGVKVRIIALTAYARKEEQDKFLKAGMDWHVSKPVNMDELVRAFCRLEDLAR